MKRIRNSEPQIGDIVEIVSPSRTDTGEIVEVEGTFFILKVTKSANSRLVGRYMPIPIAHLTEGPS